MIIQTYGLSCVSITAKPLLGEVTAVLDPFAAEVGVKVPSSVTADVVFMSQEGSEHGAIDAVSGEPFAVTMPGEYEVKGITIDARIAPTKANAKHLIARVAVEEMMVGFLGAMDRELTTGELELLEGVDVLVLPVGGGSVLSPKQAAEVIAQVEPRVVVPVHAAMPGLKKDLETMQAFVKALGVKPLEETVKLKLTKATLPQDDMQVAVVVRA